MQLEELRRLSIYPCSARNAAYCTFTTGCYLPPILIASPSAIKPVFTAPVALLTFAYPKPRDNYGLILTQSWDYE